MMGFSPDTVRELRRLLEFQRVPTALELHACDEAERLIFDNGLIHPMTLPAALRLVSEETTLGNFHLMKAVAEQIVKKLGLPQ